MIGRKIEKLRKEKKLSREKLGAMVGISYSYLYQLETGRMKTTSNDILEKIAKALDVSVMELTMGEEEVPLDKKMDRLEKEFKTLSKQLEKAGLIPIKKLIPVPVYGRVPAGIPREMFNEYIETYIYLPEEIVQEGDIAFKVIGDSMIGEDIKEGDYVIISPDLQPESGNIVLARVDRSEITLKRLRYRDNMITLVPANDEFESVEFTPEEARDRLEITGVVKRVVKSMR